MNENVGVASDINGRALQDHLVAELGLKDLTAQIGPDRPYPSVAEAAIEILRAGQVDRLVLICGTGIGMSITANKFPGVRAALVSDVYSAQRASRSNDANVLCLGSQTIGASVAPILVREWLEGSLDMARSGSKVELVAAIEQRVMAGAEGRS
ncbi:RpiB/LacA/LacB family sugar-phosphate isomerase [Microcella humidisoli]|uniref:RpiB/LacA/LacB family sugar-phosphate isomerase n=1 Tax=Microcella humidisoli TaxID=2963406 RepID=A0ABY5FZW8_9MICO|nr:RpiB/LacA/LacB family sugar-phosphate isomerase [Microcella humidisoli]UTT63679.1 RpiB/LacA/LacB family sugar-phosphate isomerase [Microcella humidisoli]